MSSFALADTASGLHGHFRLEVRRHGELVEVDDHPNVIVNLAKTQLARLIGGDVVNRSITQIGFGDGSAAPDPANTGLTNAYLRPLTGVSYPTTSSARFSWELGTTEANGMQIYEFGLFCTNGVIFARRVRSGPLAKASDLSFSGTWTISF